MTAPRWTVVGELVGLLCLGSCGATLVDPCAKVSGTCVALYVDESPPIDAVSLHIKGPTWERDSTSRSPGDQAFGSLVAVGIVLNDPLVEPSDFEVLIDVIGTRGDQVQGTGRTQAPVSRGKHTVGHVRLDRNAEPLPSLSSLTISAGTLSPTFSPTVTDYRVWVPMSVQAFNVQPVVPNPSATSIRVADTLVDSGSASPQKPLALGDNAIDIVVTAQSGKARTYHLLVQRGFAVDAYLKASNTGAGDQFGMKVALSGDTLVVGAPFEDGSGDDSGAAYVFVRAGSSWMQQAYLKASNSDAGDHFGWSVAIDGDTVVVGGVDEDSNGAGANPQANNSAVDSGAAYVFVRSGTVWTQQAYLKASNVASGDYFGYDVAISGETIVVGAPLTDKSGASNIDNSGAAYVFLRSGTAWTQQASLNIFSTTSANDHFGDRMALSGNTLVVGVALKDSSAAPADDNSGAAYVFLRSGTAWTQQAFLKPSTTLKGDNFGRSVALSGDTLVVGAPLEDSSGAVPSDQSGAAYVFVRSDTTWTQQARLRGSNTGAGDIFGISVAVSRDTIVVAGAHESSRGTGVGSNTQNDNSAKSSGAAYVFARSGTAWTEQTYLKASNTDAGDQFGLSVAISGDTVVVGAQYEDSNGIGVDPNAQADNSAADRGAVYSFRYEL